MAQKTVTRSIFSFSEISQIQVNAAFIRAAKTETTHDEIMGPSLRRRSNDIHLLNYSTV